MKELRLVLLLSLATIMLALTSFMATLWATSQTKSLLITNMGEDNRGVWLTTHTYFVMLAYTYDDPLGWKWDGPYTMNCVDVTGPEVGQERVGIVSSPAVKVHFYIAGFGYETLGLPPKHSGHWNFPFWLRTGFPTLLTLAFLSPVIRNWRKAARQTCRLKAGLCVKCGYDLRGNDSGTCPECGKVRPAAAQV